MEDMEGQLVDSRNRPLSWTWWVRWRVLWTGLCVAGAVAGTMLATLGSTQDGGVKAICWAVLLGAMFCLVVLLVLLAMKAMHAKYGPAEFKIVWRSFLTPEQSREVRDRSRLGEIFSAIDRAAAEAVSLKENLSLGWREYERWHGELQEIFRRQLRQRYIDEWAGIVSAQRKRNTPHEHRFIKLHYDECLMTLDAWRDGPHGLTRMALRDDPEEQRVVIG